MKTIYLDTETTGTDPKSCAIIQIAALIEIDGEEKDQWTATMRPHQGAFIDQNALRVNGYKQEEIGHFASPIEVYQKFVALMAKHVDRYDKQDKFQVVGYNVRFDLDMIDAMARRCGEPFLWAYLVTVFAKGDTYMAQSTTIASEFAHTIPVRDKYAKIIIEMAEKTGHSPEEVLDVLLRYHLLVAPKLITASLDASPRRPPVRQQEGGLDVRY